MSNLAPRTVSAAAALLIFSAALHAQSSPPDAGKLLRDVERAPALPPPAPPPATGPTRAPEATAGPRVQVTAFKLTGVTLLPESELQTRLAPFIGSQAGLADLQKAADAVARRYQEAGYLVRAYLPEQPLRDGVVTIAVLEGRLAAIRVEQAPPGRHISESRVRDMMTARQKIGAPVRADDVQRSIGLLNAMPGISASSVLEPGEQPGETRLVVAVKDEPSVTGQAQVDNGGARASGEWRATGGISLNSPLRFGDQLQFFASKSSGSTYGSAGYSVPLGNDGLRGGLNVSRLTYGYDLASTRYTGAAGTWGAALTYPIARSQTFNLGVSANYDRKSFDNAVAGVQINDKAVSVATLGFAGDAADNLLGGGLTQFSLTAMSGRLDLSRNAGDLAADQAAGGPQRQGHFQKILWLLARSQRIAAADTLHLTFSGQRASRNLDSGEKFNVTGNNAVRAYSSSEPSGDDAELLSAEWRHQLSDRLSVSVFHDYAHLRRDHGVNNASLSPNAYHLASNGLGLGWGRADTVLIRGAVAWRQGENPVRNAATGADSDGTHRNPRFFISLLKVF
ncbi:MAG TPA: ShlB/FhaC/HecB family hemolysin secretion/activation protein [Burkholderiaceae bacterium]|nr:ShlB/FhaC/HecB family hemolysin secretion/activation protein [Burkholderiaceae bacterium]